MTWSRHDPVLIPGRAIWTATRLPDLVACVEWSVYPCYSHNTIEMPQRPSFATRTWTTPTSKRNDNRKSR
jgi:hypothetical protein